MNERKVFQEALGWASLEVWNVLYYTRSCGLLNQQQMTTVGCLTACLMCLDWSKLYLYLSSFPQFLFRPACFECLRHRLLIMAPAHNDFACVGLFNPYTESSLAPSDTGININLPIAPTHHQGV